MSFHDVRFPESIEQGAQGGPTFSTNIVETTGGHEYRNANWSLPRYRWDVASGLKDATDYAVLLAFFNGRLGRLHSFRFKDWSDFTAPALSPVVLVPGTVSTYRLAKVYTSGPVSFYRPITKPISGAVTLSTGTVNYSTGVVTGGSGVTWHGDFDVPVRFEEDAFRLTLEQVYIGQATGVGITEVRE